MSELLHDELRRNSELARCREELIVTPAGNLLVNARREQLQRQLAHHAATMAEAAIAIALLRKACG